MRRSPRRSRLTRAAAALVAAAALGLGGCAAGRPRPPATAQSPAAVFRSLLGRNQGLTAVRALAEVRISYAGREVSLPGVLLLDAFGGFRLDLLDPLDRPQAILFAEDGRIVQYRPGLRLASSLGVFPADCQGVDPADWVAAVTSSSIAPVAGEILADGRPWWGDRSLERRRSGRLYQSIRYRDEGGQLVPRLVSWYCGDDPVLQLRFREWVRSATTLLPSRFELEYSMTGLAISIELSEIEENPPLSGQPLRPRLGSDISWTSWNLPR